MSSIYTNLEGIRQLSNSSLTSIIDVTNLNFKNLSNANLTFLKNIKYDESANDLTVNKGTFRNVELTDKISFTLDGIPTFTINSLGKAEGQELLVVVSESQRHRFTDFNDWPEVGVPGEVIYTGIQNNRPEFGEDFIGYLDGRGWVSLTNLTAPVNGIYFLPEAGSPLIIPTVPNGRGLIWIGPPGVQNKYEPVNTTVYFTDDEGNTYDIMTDFAWEIIGENAKFKPVGKAIIGDVFNPGKFQFVDNNQSAGYILHADGNGNAYWGPNVGPGGPGAANYSYWEIKDYLEDVTQTVYHNLQTLNVVVNLIDVTTNEKVDGHVDNYQTNSINVTLIEDNPNVKVVVLGAGGDGGSGGVTFLSELNDVTLMSQILDGDVLIYNSMSGQWINSPNIVSQPSIQTPDDKFLNAITTDADGDPASVGTITNTPIDGCYVEVKINGIEYEVGNGVTNKVCYFANPATPTLARGFSSAHANGQVQAGDRLYWNGSIIGFQLLNGWRVSFHYLNT